ncbi:MAG TPA: SgcJ/EcaC family oxidoreductase [Bryobacteraceae bacterium]|nr:SgcJ/EcaC family oxidoreductase [Bryobacteraceae bacterium]
MNRSNALQDIEAVFAQMAELWNRHDTRAYTALWAEDADFVNVIGMHRRGRKELLAEMDYLHADRFKDTHIRIERRTVKFLTPEFALAHVWWEMNGDPGMPGIPTVNGRRRGVFTHVLQLTPEGWRFIASQNTDVLPVPDPIRAGETVPAAAQA